MQLCVGVVDADTQCCREVATNKMGTIMLVLVFYSDVMDFDQKLGWLSICDTQICSIILIYDHDSSKVKPKRGRLLVCPPIHGAVSSIIAGRAPLSLS